MAVEYHMVTHSYYLRYNDNLTFIIIPSTGFAMTCLA